MNMYALTGEVSDNVPGVSTATDSKQQQEEHESMHRDNQETKDERDRLQEKVRDLEDTAMSEQMKSFSNDLEDQYNLDKIIEERDSLQDQVVELERRLKAASRLDERIHTNDPEPESRVDEDPKQPSQPEALKKLRYCNVCLKSVDKMSANVRLFSLCCDSNSVLISATGQNQACRQMRDQRIGVLTLNPSSSKSRKGEAKQQSRRH